MGKLSRVKGCELREEQGPFAEVFSDRRVSGDAAEGGEAHGSFLLEEGERGGELVIYEEELRTVAFWVALHFGLQCREGQELGAAGREEKAGCRHGRVLVFEYRGDDERDYE